MDKRILNLHSKFKDILQHQLIQSLDELLQHQIRFIEHILKEHKVLKKDLGDVDLHDSDWSDQAAHHCKAYLSHIIQLIRTNSGDKGEWKAYYSIEALTTDLLQLLEDLPRTQTRRQLTGRFNPQPREPWHIRLLKGVKKQIYAISIIPRRLSNAWLKFRKKEVKNIPLWRHKVPWQNLAYLHYGDHAKIEIARFLEQWLIEYEKIQSSLRVQEENFSARIASWSDSLMEEKPEEILPVLSIQAKQYKELGNQIEKLRSLLKKSVDEILQKVLDDFARDVPLAGTIELPGFRVRRSMVKRKFRIASKEFSKTFSEYV